MISFLHPYILLLTPFALLARVLHKKKSSPSKHYVPNIIFWDSEKSGETRPDKDSKTSPLWILSALIIINIIVSLAKPLYQSHKPGLVVWLDTSESMFSNEGKISRIKLGLNKLINKVKKNKIGGFYIKILGNPHQKYRFNSSGLTTDELLSDLNISSPSPIRSFPKIAHASHDEYWLITDDTKKGTQRWANSLHISTVINVGHETENTEIERMAIRKSLYGNYYYGFIKISNHGLQPNQRKLTIKNGNVPIIKKTIRIGAGDSITTNFRINFTNKNPVLTATILPHDSLLIDDKLSLRKATGLTKILSVNYDENCPPVIHSILSAYPNLIINNANTQAELSIDCGSHPPKQGKHYFFISTSRHKYRLNQYPSWHTNQHGLSDIYIGPDEVKANAIITNSPGWSNLLTYGKYALIRLNKNKKSMEMYINLAQSSITKKIIFPLLFNKLLEVLLDSSLLDIHKNIQQRYHDSDIRPIKIFSNAARPQHIDYRHSISYVFLVLAIALIVIEIFLINISHKEI